MSFQASVNFPQLEDRTPRRNPWLLFKVGHLDHLLALQQGLIYMNSLEYFSSLSGEEHIALRKDELEKVYARYKAGHVGDRVQVLEMSVSHGEHVKTMNLGDGAVMTIYFPRPSNVMLYCMSAFADDETGKIPGEVDGEIRLDERFLRFGSHLLLIRKANEFAKRLNSAIAKHPTIYNSEFFEGGYGLVDYLKLDEHSGNIGLFRKDLIYSWQNEFRICFGVMNETLNSLGAFELNIGDISDISQIIPVQTLINEPLELTRRIFKKDGDKYIQV